MPKVMRAYLQPNEQMDPKECDRIILMTVTGEAVAHIDNPDVTYVGRGFMLLAPKE